MSRDAVAVAGDGRGRVRPRPPGRRRVALLVLVLAVLLLEGVFLLLAAAARTGGGDGFPVDAAVLEAVAGLRTPWLTTAVELFTRTGGVLVVAPVLAGVVWLWRRADRSAAVVLALSSALAPLLASATKALVQRPRPVVVEPLVTTTTLSFPSGHALTAVGAYGMLAVLLWRRARRGLAVACGSWALLVGATRVYLGVHHPTDVLGSLAAGSALLVVLVTLQGWWRDRRQRRRPPARWARGRGSDDRTSARGRGRRSAGLSS